MREDMISDLIGLLFLSFIIFYWGPFFSLICIILEQHSSQSLINNKINRKSGYTIQSTPYSYWIPRHLPRTRAKGVNSQGGTLHTHVWTT